MPNKKQCLLIGGSFFVVLLFFKIYATDDLVFDQLKIGTFNSLEFYIFLAVVLTTLLVIENRKIQHVFLLFSSYFFFYFTNTYMISLLFVTTVLDFYLAKKIYSTTNKKTKKILLLVSLSANLGMLGFFKYADFGIQQINILTNSIGLAQIESLGLILPVGISFYVFQTLSYTVDVYRNHLPPSQSLKEFALFVTFFPQLVAGPILRASQFLPQLRDKMISGTQSYAKQIVISKSSLRFGITLIVLGLFKKMFFADNISPLVSQIFDQTLGTDSFSIILGTVAYGIEIYCDFSGYSDIAIGLAAILGFNIPINFNKPYFASSPSDFWKRWHISLSSWLRDYLYIPLGGNRKSSLRTYGNLVVVMVLGGLWHGASWNFAVWGLLHGIYLAVHLLVLRKFSVIGNNVFFKSKLVKILAILITQYFVFLTWIPFRIHDVNYMLYAMNKFVLWDFVTEKIIYLISINPFPVALIVIFISLHFISYKIGDLPNILSQLSFAKWLTFLGVVIFFIVYCYNGSTTDYIYYRF
jgi:alginate O-acetyltransferase complex protein AlgI